MRALYGKNDQGIGAMTIIIVAIIVAVVLASTVVYFSMQGSKNKYNKEPDLKLTLTLSKQSLNKGEELNVSVELFNSDPYFITANVSNNWPYFLGGKYRLTMGPCDLNLPFGIAVLSGNYSTADYSQGKPLNLYNPAGIYSCPVLINFNGYKFFPLSDKASLIGSGNPPANITLRSTDYLNGSWFYESNHWEFRNFSAGIYTVVAADEWGEIQISHFYVY